MRLAITILCLLLLMPMALADVHMEVRPVNAQPDYLYTRTHFSNSVPVALEGRVFTTIPELGLASPKARVSQFSSGSGVSVGNVLEGDLNDFEYVRVSFTADDGTRSIRHIPREYLY